MMKEMTRAGVIGGGNAGQDEDPCADDTADAQHGQAESPQDAVHAAVLFRFRQELVDAFRSENIL